MLRGRKQRHHHLLFLCRHADVGIPKVELSVRRFDDLLESMAQTPFSPPCKHGDARCSNATSRRRAACHHVEMCFRPRSTRGRAHKSAQAILHCGQMRKLIGRASVFSAQFQSLNWAVIFVFAQLGWQRNAAIPLCAKLLPTQTHEAGCADATASICSC